MSLSERSRIVGGRIVLAMPLAACVPEGFAAGVGSGGSAVEVQGALPESMQSSSGSSGDSLDVLIEATPDDSPDVTPEADDGT